MHYYDFAPLLLLLDYDITLFVDSSMYRFAVSTNAGLLLYSITLLLFYSVTRLLYMVEAQLGGSAPCSPQCGA